MGLVLCLPFTWVYGYVGGWIYGCGDAIVVFLVLIVVDFDLPDLVVSLWLCYGFLEWFGFVDFAWD